MMFGIVNESFAQLTYDTLQVQYDSAWTFRNLTLIPIRYNNSAQKKPAPKSKIPHFISLDEAMQKGKVKVREIQFEQGADVNTLEMTNTSKDHIVINGGEILAGGKQDRMIAETQILAPGKEVNYVNVFCVEKGRWDKKPKGFKRSGHADMQLKKVMDVSKRQSDVWKEIQRQFSATKKTSETYPYISLYNSNAEIDTAYLNYFANRYKASDSLYAGFIGITGKRIISTEIFGSAELTQLSFLPLLKGFIHAVVLAGSKPSMALESTKNFMDQLLTSEAMQRKFIAGRGRIDRHENRAIHLVAYGD